MSGHVSYEASEPKLTVWYWILIGTGLLIFASFIGVLMSYESSLDRELASKAIIEPSTELTQLRVYELETKNKLAYIDKAKGQVHIPISMAMDSVINQYQK